MGQDSVVLLITACGRSQIEIPYEGKSLIIDKDSLPAGVAQLTLEQKGNVLADRLVYVHHSEHQKAPLQILGIKKDYEPLEKVSLKIRGTEESFLSISVRDKTSSDLTYDNGNIMTEMLLSSHIKGFVENPGYYFEADDEEHRRHLDLMLMVQGWRRFDIKQTEIVEPYEKSQIIRGEVCKYIPLDQEDGFYLEEDKIKETLECSIPLWLQTELDSIGEGHIQVSRNGETYEVEHLENPKEKTHLHVEFVQPGTSPVYGDMVVDKDGMFSFQAPHFGGSCFMHLAAIGQEKFSATEKIDEKKAQKRQKKRNGRGWEVSHQWLLPNTSKTADYNIRVHRCYPRFVKNFEYYQLQFMPGENESEVKQGISDGVRTLQEVKVTTKRRILRKVNLDKPAFVMDVYDAFNQLADAGLTCAYYAGSWSFSDILCRMIVGDMGLHSVNIKASRRWDGRTIDVNSIKVKEEQLKYNHLENLDKVYVYTDYAPRKEGSSIYMGAEQPEVVIDLHRFPDDSKRIVYRDRFIVLNGYSTSSEFYNPDYSRIKLPEGQKDYRRTLYWNPNLKLDENGEATITFFNNSRTTRLSVEAEGQAADGTLLWGKTE